MFPPILPRPIMARRVLRPPLPFPAAREVVFAALRSLDFFPALTFIFPPGGPSLLLEWRGGRVCAGPAGLLRPEPFPASRSRTALPESEGPSWQARGFAQNG